MSRLFLYGRAILEGSAGYLIGERVLVQIEEGWITGVETAPAHPLPTETVVLDDSEIMTPGFIDMHAHLKMQGVAPSVIEHRAGDTTSARIARYDESLGGMDQKSVHSATRTAALALSRSGVTTCWTRPYFRRMSEELAPFAPRLVLGRTLRKDQRLDARLAEAKELIRERYSLEGTFIPSLVLHEAGLPDAVLETVVKLSGEHLDGPLPTQAHVAQRPEEVDELGETAVERLARTGVLATRSFFAVHATYCSGTDYDTLEHFQVPVIYCPVAARAAKVSNPCRDLDGRVPILLGTDTPPFRMGEQLAAAASDTDLSWSQVFEAVTSRAASCLGLRTGSILPGRIADIAVWNLCRERERGLSETLEIVAKAEATVATLKAGTVVHAREDFRRRMDREVAKRETHNDGSRR